MMKAGWVSMLLIIFVNMACVSAEQNSKDREPESFELTDSFNTEELDASTLDWVDSKYKWVVLHSYTQRDELDTYHEEVIRKKDIHGRIWLDNEFIRRRNAMHSSVKDVQQYFFDDNETIYVGIGGLTPDSNVLDLYECGAYSYKPLLYNYFTPSFYIDCSLSPRDMSVITYYPLQKDLSIQIANTIWSSTKETAKGIEDDLKSYEIYMYFKNHQKGLRFNHYAEPRKGSPFEIDARLISPEGY